MDILKNKLESLGLTALSPAPNDRQAEWLRREKSVFFHFGMNTFTNMEWGDGTESPATFKPDCLDCRQWIKAVKDAGFKAAILTAKHHDGFCLWPSKYTEHSVKNSPYKNGKGDIVKEFTDACHEFGIKAGIYLSPWDRHEKTWSTPDYDDFYVGQLTELLTNYGKIWEVWWDGSQSKKIKYDWKRYADTIRTLQPDAVIFGSLGAEPYVEARWVGNESGFAGDPCWSTIDSQTIIDETTSVLNSGRLDGNRFLPAEADVSIRPGWFYHAEQDGEVRDVSNLLQLWFLSCGRNASILLNLPPDRRGLVHENDVDSLLEFNNILSGTLANNLAKGAKATADSVRDAICNADNMLTDDINEFYASADGDNTPEIIFELDEPKEFNTFILQEVIELGHRVTGFEVSALVDGEWKNLYKGECIGYRSAQHFDTVKADKVKVKITSSLASPVLRFFGLYKFDESLLLSKEYALSDENILDGEAAVVKREGNAYDLHLGGIIPFNLITIESPVDKKFEIYLFNGFDFEPCPTDVNFDDGLAEINFDKPIGWCYRIKIVFDNEDRLDEVKLGVYLK
ncbi:MAG: alpha-L-fucosidase [Clostridia bacterium]|nr:alpha-L-fucosidase [Clostridia bacterium]